MNASATRTSRGLRARLARLARRPTSLGQLFVIQGWISPSAI